MTERGREGKRERGRGREGGETPPLLLLPLLPEIKKIIRT
jgi:hypothetical protein